MQHTDITIDHVRAAINHQSFPKAGGTLQALRLSLRNTLGSESSACLFGGKERAALAHLRRLVDELVSLDEVEQLPMYRSMRYYRPLSAEILEARRSAQSAVAQHARNARQLGESMERCGIKSAVAPAHGGATDITLDAEETAKLLAIVEFYLSYVPDHADPSLHAKQWNEATS